jgi:hypothetical protein
MQTERYRLTAIVPVLAAPAFGINRPLLGKRPMRPFQGRRRRNEPIAALTVGLHQLTPHWACA